jgi:hypothetical protein
LFSSKIFKIFSNQLNLKSKQVLNISEGINVMGNLELPLVLALILAWFLVFAALVKGVQSLGIIFL